MLQRSLRVFRFFLPVLLGRSQCFYNSVVVAVMRIYNPVVAVCRCKKCARKVARPQWYRHGTGLKHCPENNVPSRADSVRVLYYTAMHCTALHGTVLYCTVLYCDVLCCAVLYSTVLCCAVLCCAGCAVLYCTVLYCTVLCRSVPYCTVRCCAVPHYTVRYFAVAPCYMISSNTPWPHACKCTYSAHARPG